MALVISGGHSSEGTKEENSGEALLDAVKSGDDAAVQEVLRRENVSLRTKDSDGQTALHLAVYEDRKSIARILLNKGADTEAAQNSGEKPLYLAANLGNRLMVELLVEFNANVEALNLKTRTTALHAAVGKRYIQVARVLLRHGADVDSRDLVGATPLCIAVRTGDLMSVELLLQYGANKKIRLPDGGRTVEDLAAGDNAMIDILNTVPLLEGPPILPLKVNEKLSLPVVEDEPSILKACHGFEASIVDFYIDDRERRIQVSASVHELLYGRGPKEILSTERKSKMVDKPPDFRWYHLPANNMAWVNDLVARHYIDRESGPTPALIQADLQSTLGLNTAARRQYRGSTVHSSFMRPVCQTIKSRSSIPRSRAIEHNTDGDELIRSPQKQVNHIMLFMPFLHFETSEGYNKMSRAILEAKQERGRKAENQTPKVKPQPKEPPQAKMNIDDENLTREKEQAQQSKKMKKVQAAGNDGNESHVEEDSSSSKHEGAGTGDGVSNPVTLGVPSSASWEGAKHQNQTHIATNTSGKQANDLAEENSRDEKIDERRQNRPDDVRVGDFSLLKDQTNDTEKPALQAPNNIPEIMAEKPKAGKVYTATGQISSESTPIVQDLQLDLILEDPQADLHSAGNDGSSSASHSPGDLDRSNGNPQIISGQEESSVPNFVLTSEPGRSMFDFPQPERIPSASNEANSNWKSTPASVSFQDSRAESQDNKEKMPPNRSVEHVPNKKTVKFKDAIGRTFSFPYDLCKTWAGMEDFIQQAFSEIESHRSQVNEGLYDLLGPNEAFISPVDWDKIIEPDMFITMIMRPENPHENLIKGYLPPRKSGGVSALQPRRTLDQYFYTHLENTLQRDKDQVVYRYTERNSEPKIFMVDQLWLWVLDNDTVISCCPQRWESWGNATTHSLPKSDNGTNPGHAPKPQHNPLTTRYEVPQPSSWGRREIKFMDAVGRKFTFPFDLCKSWKGMEALIREAFLHVAVIGSHVIDGHYDLIGPNQEIILPGVWEHVIQPGWSIRMMMWPIPEAPPNGRRFPPGPPGPPGNLSQGPIFPPQPGLPPPPGSRQRPWARHFGPDGSQPPIPESSRPSRGPPLPPSWTSGPALKSQSTKRNASEKTPNDPPPPGVSQHGPIGPMAPNTDSKQNPPPTFLPSSPPKPSSSSRKIPGQPPGFVTQPQSKNPGTSSGKTRTAEALGQQSRNFPHVANSRLPLIQNDPLNVQQTIIAHLTLSSRAPVTSVYDLAALVANSCATVFDQNHIPYEFQFLDFFEHSIGAVIDKEAQYLQEFTEGLDRLNRSPDAESDKLLGISRETKLLVEVKDIRDELSILKMVLKDQETTMNEMGMIIEEAKTKLSVEQASHSSHKRNRILESHLFRIEKMQELANKAYEDIKYLLDLKQKQANISEALSARKQAENIAEQSRIAAGHAKDGARQAELGVEQSALLVEQAALAGKQAEETARQGKTLLVFTIITIVFLPLLFMAAFFAINIDSFAFNDNGKLPLGYVLKYMLSLAFAASVPFIFLAFYQHKITSWLTSSTKRVVKHIPQWLKTPLAIISLLGVTSVLAIILPIIWTRHLASTAKAAVTIALVLLIVVAGVVFAIYAYYVSGRSRLENPSSDDESSLVDD